MLTSEGGSTSAALCFVISSGTKCSREISPLRQSSPYGSFLLIAKSFALSEASPLSHKAGFMGALIFASVEMTRRRVCTIPCRGRRPRRPAFNRLFKINRKNSFGHLPKLFCCSYPCFPIALIGASSRSIA